MIYSKLLKSVLALVVFLSAASCKTLKEHKHSNIQTAGSAEISAVSKDTIDLATFMGNSSITMEELFVEIQRIIMPLHEPGGSYQSLDRNTQILITRKKSRLLEELGQLTQDGFRWKWRPNIDLESGTITDLVLPVNLENDNLLRGQPADMPPPLYSMFKRILNNPDILQKRLLIYPEVKISDGIIQWK